MGYMLLVISSKYVIIITRALRVVAVTHTHSADECVQTCLQRNDG